LFSLTINAQQRQRASQKCISTTVVIKQKVTVTTIDKCKKTKVIKTYTKKEWEKLVAQRREQARKRRGGK
jgi:hypothetical protein